MRAALVLVLGMRSKMHRSCLDDSADCITRREAGSIIRGPLVSDFDSVRFLYHSANEFKSARFGLDRIRAALDALGNPQHRLRVVHVAGTNGKGSTCAMIESALRRTGAKTGLFTSPHLAEPMERIRID